MEQRFPGLGEAGSTRGVVGLKNPMQKFSREVVAEVRAANDIVDVIGAVLELKPDGAGRFKACCPFHSEKTPSFKVSRERQQFRCFGCGKFGDVIGFLCEYEGLTFMESLRKLADRSGVRLPALSERDNKEDYIRGQLIEFGKTACAFYQQVLDDPLKGSACRQYLKQRALRPETLKKFSLGYAPDAWSALLDKGRTGGFKDNVLEASGLAKRSDKGSLYDFFRNRLMIPIRDVSGNVVAFGGRDLGDGIPKYINSPENALYKKSRVLYGLFEAREAMRREKRVILVEGYFDLMRCFDAGIENVVATCGTALTPEQAQLIYRYVREVVIVYDADAAGIKAALRGVGLLTNAGLTVRAMALPDGKDPDDYVKAHGADAFRSLVDSADDFVTFYITMSQGQAATIEGRTAVARELFAILADVNDELRRGEYVKRTAEALGLHEWTCRAEFEKFIREQAGRTKPVAAAAARPEAIKPADCDFVAALLASPSLLRQAQDELRSVPLQPGPVAEILIALFEGVDTDLVDRIESGPARELYAAAATGSQVPVAKADEIVSRRISGLKKSALETEIARLQDEIAEAQRRKEDVRAVQLLAQKNDKKRQIEKIGAV